MGEPAAFQGAAGQLGQGVGVALAAAAGVVGVGRAGQGLQGGQQGRPASGSSSPSMATIPSKVGASQSPRRA